MVLLYMYLVDFVLNKLLILIRWKWLEREKVSSLIFFHLQYVRRPPCHHYSTILMTRIHAIRYQPVSGKKQGALAFLLTKQLHDSVPCHRRAGRYTRILLLLERATFNQCDNAIFEYCLSFPVAVSMFHFHGWLAYDGRKWLTYVENINLWRL